LLAVVVIGCETTATARWALLFIVRTFFKDTITVAVWAGFHVRLTRMLPHSHGYYADASLIAFASEFGVLAGHWMGSPCVLALE
jgi:hypothetical protein